MAALRDTKPSKGFGTVNCRKWKRFFALTYNHTSVGESQLPTGNSNRRRLSRHTVKISGVPQAGVLSLFSFNIYLRDLPTPPEGVILISYADDCSILASGNSITLICRIINQYLCKWQGELLLEL